MKGSSSYYDRPARYQYRVRREDRRQMQSVSSGRAETMNLIIWSWWWSSLPMVIDMGVSTWSLSSTWFKPVPTRFLHGWPGVFFSATRRRAASADAFDRFRPAPCSAIITGARAMEVTVVPPGSRLPATKCARSLRNQVTNSAPITTPVAVLACGSARSELPVRSTVFPWLR